MTFQAIPFEWMRPHTTAAVRQGWSLDSLLAKSMIQLRHGDNRDTIGAEQAILLCTHTVLAAEDATHGMARTGLPAKYPAIGITMALGCANFETAIEKLCRLYGSASGAVQLQLRTEREDAILSVRMEAIDELEVAYLEENFLMWVYIQCQHFLGRDLPVSTVTVRDPLHFNLARLHWGIRGRVQYGETTSFRFPRALLARAPARRAGRDLMWECQKSFLARLASGPPPTFAVDFADAPGVRFADLVRESGKSANTLRRRLQATDGGFRIVRQRALVEAATARLTAGDDSVEAIAAELGYADARSFRRFLKGATGLTPAQIRDRGGERPAETLSVLQELKAIIQQMDV